MRTALGSGNRLKHIDGLSGNESNTPAVQFSINNIDTIYFPNFSIFKHVHVVKFSFFDSSGKDHIISILEILGFKRTSKLKLIKGNYLRRSHYEKGMMVVDVLYQLKPDRGAFPSSLVEVHNAAREFIDLLVSFCKYNGLTGKVSKIELAFDFYTKDIWDMFAFLRSCVFMKKQRSRSNEYYPTTFYANHIKRQSKGLKVYYRKGNKFVRLKLTLKRSVIKKLDIDMSLKAVESINPFDYFTFMQLDQECLREFVIWQSRDEIARLEKESRFGAALCYCHIDSWLSSWPLEPESLMGKVDVLKSKSNGIPNYTRFLAPLDDFIERFSAEIQGQLFVPSQKYWEYALASHEANLVGIAWLRDAEQIMKNNKGGIEK